MLCFFYKRHQCVQREVQFENYTSIKHAHNFILETACSDSKGGNTVLACVWVDHGLTISDPAHIHNDAVPDSEVTSRPRTAQSRTRFNMTSFAIKTGLLEASRLVIPRVMCQTRMWKTKQQTLSISCRKANDSMLKLHRSNTCIKTMRQRTSSMIGPIKARDTTIDAENLMIG